jgi:hypothetical protein
VLSVLLAALFAFVIGLAFTFAGYRVFLVLLPIWGFFAGLWFGAEAIIVMFGGGFLATTTGLVFGFILGLLVGVFSYLFYMVGVAIVAAGLGASIGGGFMAALGFDPGLITAIVIVVTALVVALLVLAFNLQKYVVIALTAFAGTNAILLSILLVLGRVELQQISGAGNAIAPILQDSWFWLIAWLVVAAAGFVVQLRANRSYTFTRAELSEDWG